jgi:energy-coupling factor transporter ATP-binding protein EcfA2
VTALSNDQPYPGLRPYGSGDEEFFFGREAQARGLRLKLETGRLVAVVGRSGCGKSSLVLAGLMPLLNKEINQDGRRTWRIASFRPQGRPIAELAKELFRLASEAPAAPADRQARPETGGAPSEPSAGTQSQIQPAEMEELRRSRLDAMLRRSSQGLVEAASELRMDSSERLLIIVDQFEEIFRFEDPSGRNADEATAFVRLLIEAINAESPRIQIILTMRLDFLGDCARFARLPEAISDGQFLVPNLSRAERRAAIEEPAKKAGKLVRPEVTQRLLNEIGEDPEQLPVLQHVLMRMWQNASAKAEITLKDYEDAGGVTAAISRHADRIYNGLATDAHRKAAERLFKAISERDRRGRSIRRATALGEIQGIVAGDDASASVIPDPNKLNSVIDAFRAPDCCFLMPPADEALAPDRLVDISHESLLRGWGKLTGKTGTDGWIAEEERDGRTYSGLLDAAENESILPAKVALQRRQWWDNARPNEAWAKRYGDKFSTVEEFMRTNARRAFVRRLAIIALVALAAISSIGFGLYFSYEAVRRSEKDIYYTELARQNRENLSKLAQAQTQIQAQEKELDKRNKELDQTIRNAQKSLPSGYEKTHEDLDKLLNQSAAGLDTVVQRAVVDSKAGTPPTLSSDAGFLWIGSAQAGNLTTLDGVPVLPLAVKTNAEYLISLDIYLRQGLPDRTSYAQQPTLGIMPDGTRVLILDVAPPFSRPSGDQYWAQVRVTKLALPTIYFQFAGGSRDQAQQLSKALQDKGYKIPGEERIATAAGKREVRYFYAAQKTIAAQLASDTTQILQRLGYPSLSVSAVFAGDPTKSNPDGKLELWLEIPPK